MKLCNEVTPFITVKNIVPRNASQHMRTEVALNLVFFHRKVTNQNDTYHKYSLILY